MRVLFVITELHTGGAENAMAEIACGLREKAHDVQVVCLFGDKGEIPRRLRAAGIPVHSLGIHRSAQVYKARRMAAIVREAKPDIIHTWLFHANVLGRLVLPEDVPLLCSLRVVEPRKSHIMADRLTRRRVERYLCVSDDVRTFAVSQLAVPPERVHVIENGIDIQRFESSRTAPRTFEAINGLTIARVTEQKGIDILLRALATLPAMGSWRWTFVGAQPEPVYQKKLQELAAQLAITDHITWTGAATRDEITAYFAAANLFALPSRWEGQANVVLESMAAGVPVLTSATHGIRSLFDRGVDSLTVVPENTPECWRTTIEHIWSDKGAIAKQIEAAFDVVKTRPWSAVVQRHLDVYEDILRSRHTAAAQR